MTTAGDLFTAAITTDGTGDVCHVDLALARQAIELQISIGEDVSELMHPHRWWFRPHCALSLAFDGDDLDRECRLYSVWCVRQALPLVDAEFRTGLAEALSVAEQYAHSSATTFHLRAAAGRAREIKQRAGLQTRLDIVAAVADAAIAVCSQAGPQPFTVAVSGEVIDAVGIAAHDSYSPPAWSLGSSPTKQPNISASADIDAAVDAAEDRARRQQQNRLIALVAAALQ